ncbi:MAG: Unknown protein [uncultured Sulfurovum sp.]|uniref:ATPase AAA-type core domain-containing protein n=1 Tax=uncultured Sulfurovum sp. TaxID=269237 RepID=A0A6S6RT66_9BACT|nr:MAG: Unknown protein [uncultured Sulfurovum sp.]
MVTPTVDSILSNKKGTPMNEHFIKNIEIKNFKCFDDFKAEGFGRVNLIGGKNNVGKTAFMEALFFNTTVIKFSFESLIKSLISIHVFRNYQMLYTLSDANNNAYSQLIFSFLKEYFNVSLLTNKNNLTIKLKNNEVIINIDDKIFTNNDFDSIFIETKIPLAHNFISSLFIGGEQLINLYDGVKLLRKREEINKFINKFDSDLGEYEIIDAMPVCFSKKLNTFVNLDAYGNGLKRYIAYVCAIWANQGGYIFIDEVENGIHYTNLDKLWEVLLQTSKEANCQLFITTHSKECIESYARVAKKLEDEEIAFIELGRNKNDELKAMVYPYEWFHDEIEQDHEVRGW